MKAFKVIVICGILGIITLYLLNETFGVKSDFLLGQYQYMYNGQGPDGASTSERPFPTVLSKSASLPNNNFTRENTPVYNYRHRYICEILLNEGGPVYNSNYLVEDCVRLVDIHPRLYEFLLKTKDYIAWHRKRVEELSKSKKDISDERTLVGTCPHWNSGCGGYGSQMLCLGFAFVLAVSTERLLLLKWPEISILGDQLKLDIFNPSTFDWSAFDNDIHIDQVPTFKITDLCSDVLSQSTTTVFYDVSAWTTSKRMDCMKHLDYITTDILDYQISQFESNFNDCLLFILIRILFKFGEPVRKVETKFWELQGLHGNVEYGAIHIRTGAFDSGINERHTKKSYRFLRTKDEWKKQIDCALKIKEERHIDAPLFVASDSTDCKNWAKETYKEKITTLDVIPKHTVKDKHAKKTPEESKQEEVRNVADLAIMAHAQFFIASKSLYPRLSSYLGGLSSKQLQFHQCRY